MSNILSAEVIAKLNEKLGGLLDLVNTTNAEKLFELIVKYNITSYTANLIISTVVIVVSIIGIVISYRKLCKDYFDWEGLWVGIILVSAIFIIVALMVVYDAGYSLFIWTTNPEISVIKWLR